MNETQTVKSGVLQVEYTIRKELVDDMGWYDWVLSNDLESEEWFVTLEEAEFNVRSRFL